MIPNPRGGIEVIGGLVAFGLLALAAVIFVQPGPEAFQRLGLFFGVLGVGVAAIAGLLKSGEAARQTNGQLDDRIRLAVYQALDARRRGDPPPPIDPTPVADPVSAE